MTGILRQLKWESLKKRRKDNRLILLYKGLKGKASVPTDDLIPKTRCCRNQYSMAFQTPIANTMFIKVASSPRLSGIKMPSPILWSHLLQMQRIVLLSSFLLWELGTNSLITGPGEWLSFLRFTSKLSWSWSLITAGGVIKLEEVWQAHSSRLFQVRFLRGDLAICHTPGMCIINHRNHRYNTLEEPLYHLLQRSHKPSLWQPFDLSSIATRQGP